MTLFVGGIHAVGKTFLLKPVCEHLGLRHATASQLIKEQRGIESWTVSRQVESVADNQQALVAAVKRLKISGETLVLDGHFVLRRSINAHEKIGLETYAQLSVSGVLLLEAPSEIVAERLLRRGDTTWRISEIEVFADMELEHAQFVCQQLGVQFSRLVLPSASDLAHALTNLVAAARA